MDIAKDFGRLHNILSMILKNRAKYEQETGLDVSCKIVKQAYFENKDQCFTVAKAM